MPLRLREQGGDVHDRLNVFGVQSFKIAGNYYSTVLLLEKLDTYLIPFFFSNLIDSITPGNVGANTYITAIAIQLRRRRLSGSGYQRYSF